MIWQLILGIILIILMIILIWPSYKLTKRNVRAREIKIGNNASFSGTDWFIIYVGHYLMWSLVVILFIIGGGFIFVFAGS